MESSPPPLPCFSFLSERKSLLQIPQILLSARRRSIGPRCSLIFYSDKDVLLQRHRLHTVSLGPIWLSRAPKNPSIKYSLCETVRDRRALQSARLYTSSARCDAMFNISEGTSRTRRFWSWWKVRAVCMQSFRCFSLFFRTSVNLASLNFRDSSFRVSGNEASNVDCFLAEDISVRFSFTCNMLHFYVNYV